MTSVSKPRAFAHDVLRVEMAEVAWAMPLWAAAPHRCIEVPVDVGVRMEGEATVAVFHAGEAWHGAGLGHALGASVLFDVVDALRAAARHGYGAGDFLDGPPIAVPGTQYTRGSRRASPLEPRFRMRGARPGLALRFPSSPRDPKRDAALVSETKRRLLQPRGERTPGVVSSWWRRAFGGAGVDNADNTRSSTVLRAMSRDSDGDIHSLHARLTAFFAGAEARALYDVDAVVDAGIADLGRRTVAEPALWRFAEVAARGRAFARIVLDKIRGADAGAVGPFELAVIDAVDDASVDDALIAVVADADAPQGSRVVATQVLAARRTQRAAPALARVLREPLAWLREEVLTALDELPGEHAIVVDTNGVAPCPHPWEAAVSSGFRAPVPQAEWSDVPPLRVEQRFCAECNASVVRARDFWRVQRPVPHVDDDDTIHVAVGAAPAPVEHTLLLGAQLLASAHWDGAEIRHPLIEGTPRILNAGAGVVVVIDDQDAHQSLDARAAGASLSRGPLRFVVERPLHVAVTAADGRLGELVPIHAPYDVGVVG